MVQIQWTHRAFEDALIIKNYISENSVFYASVTIEKIKSRVQILKKFPQIGRIVPEFNNETIRELIEGNYRIVYRVVSETQIDIIAIAHGAREIKNLKII